MQSRLGIWGQMLVYSAGSTNEEQLTVWLEGFLSSRQPDPIASLSACHLSH